MERCQGIDTGQISDDFVSFPGKDIQDNRRGIPVLHFIPWRTISCDIASIVALFFSVFNICKRRIRHVFINVEQENGSIGIRKFFKMGACENGRGYLCTFGNAGGVVTVIQFPVFYV